MVHCKITFLMSCVSSFMGGPLVLSFVGLGSLHGRDNDSIAKKPSSISLCIEIWSDRSSRRSVFPVVTFRTSLTFVSRESVRCMSAPRPSVFINTKTQTCFCCCSQLCGCARESENRGPRIESDLKEKKRQYLPTYNCFLLVVFSALMAAAGVWVVRCICRTWTPCFLFRDCKNFPGPLVRGF